MKAHGIWMVGVVALLAGFALGWLVFRGRAPELENPLVNRLKAERDSLVRLSAAYEARIAVWQDSVRLLDGQIVRMDSANRVLATKASFYEKQMGSYRGTADDLHRDLNRVIRNMVDSVRATDPTIGLRR